MRVVLAHALAVGESLGSARVSVGHARHVVDPIADEAEQRVQPLERLLSLDGGSKRPDGAVGLGLRCLLEEYARRRDLG